MRSDLTSEAVWRQYWPQNLLFRTSIQNLEVLLTKIKRMEVFLKTFQSPNNRHTFLQKSSNTKILTNLQKANFSIYLMSTAGLLGRVWTLLDIHYSHSPWQSRVDHALGIESILCLLQGVQGLQDLLLLFFLNISGVVHPLDFGFHLPLQTSLLSINLRWNKNQFNQLQPRYVQGNNVFLHTFCTLHLVTIHSRSVRKHANGKFLY